jgi:pimeloyl-ACP methyl ester carboxylesterase
MMNHEPSSMTLSDEERRLLALWAADCAERVLPLFEAKAPSDTRPREAIAGIRAFAHGGKRTAHLRDWGGPDVPPALLLVHGLASNARTWDLLAPLLVPNFRLIAIEARGHGVSAKPDDGYDLPTIAGDLARAIAALGWSRPLVVGHSWGAHVALQLPADYPYLPAGIVLLDGGTNELASVMPLEETLERLAPPRLAGAPRSWSGCAAT